MVEFERIKSEIAELEADINGHQEFSSMVQQQDSQDCSNDEL